MVLFKGFRAKAQQKYERDLGAEASVAALAALALHPFVNGSPRPSSRDFEKTIRTSSFKFSLEVRGVKTEDELRDLARSYVRSWLSEAQHFDEEHYWEEFAQALGATGRTGETALDVLGGGTYTTRLSP